MAKKTSGDKIGSTGKKKQSGGIRTTITSVLLGLVVIIALIIGQITGIDIAGIIGLTTPLPVSTGTVISTQPPELATQVAGIPTLAPVTPITAAPGSVAVIPVQQGFGAQKGFWQVFFTAPTGSRDPSTYVGGIENQLAAAIDGVQRTLDIAAFEWNLPLLTQAVIRAHQRGVRVRMVTDNEHGLNDNASLIPQLVQAGIPVVDDNRSGLMHNKFMIMDSQVVWTGSWNYTVNDTYRNNNNAIVIRAQKIVQNYQAEFNEMFVDRQFGVRSPQNTPNVSFVQNNITIQTYFAAEDPVIPGLIAALSEAKSSVRFMTFSFTDYDVAATMLNSAANGVNVRGIFETTGSETQASELRTLFCAGIDARQDGNSFILHHKVFIVDETTVVTGSFNISTNATRSNDENLVIISDPDLAALYVAEFERRWAEARVPARLTCQ